MRGCGNVQSRFSSSRITSTSEYESQAYFAGLSSRVTGVGLRPSFRINHAYVLPSSLRPTAVQRTIPHEHAIDGVPFPSIRDRMILLRGRYDLIDAYQGLLQGVRPGSFLLTMRPSTRFGRSSLDS
jgi:hypothetical protein